MSDNPELHRARHVARRRCPTQSDNSGIVPDQNVRVHLHKILCYTKKHSFLRTSTTLLFSTCGSSEPEYATTTIDVPCVADSGYDWIYRVRPQTIRAPRRPSNTFCRTIRRYTEPNTQHPSSTLTWLDGPDLTSDRSTKLWTVWHLTLEHP